MHYSVDDWASTHDVDARDTGIGLWVVDILADLPEGASIVFTIHWTADVRWQARDLAVAVGAAEAAATVEGPV